ncbi:MAG TPA: radical SAM protein [Vicinamibacterales bacterium]|nr:radical SAM protein [Vicinamibacterales bacterium]
MEPLNATSFQRPYVISWNLTYRCNLACEHCYLDAGGTPLVGTENFADRSELGTAECFRVIDEIAAFAPECLTILTGGEPLMRRDILEIVRRATERGLWVVVGTNGVRVSENVARRLADAGARGLSLSLDALDPDRHDRFRRVRGAWQNTVEGAEILNRNGLPFIVQTTAGTHNLGELEAIADFAYERLAAKVWNLYFLVPTGRGQFVSDITPVEYDGVLASLYRIQQKYSGRMLVNAKCAPHYIKTVLEKAAPPERASTDAGSAAPSPVPSPIRIYAGGAGGCPAGTHYMGIRPNGDVTPCPYLPVFAGNLRTANLADVWASSGLFTDIRRRSSLGGRCGECELHGHCGGCRARAYGMTGDLMAEDPLCTHTPGRFAGSPLLTLHSPAAGPGAPGSRAIEYGPESPKTIAWDEPASARMTKIPAFVRGMVIKAVEDSCRRNGIDRVTVEELERIRARMPTPKLFAGAPAARPATDGDGGSGGAKPPGL